MSSFAHIEMTVYQGLHNLRELMDILVITFSTVRCVGGCQRKENPQKISVVKGFLKVFEI